MTTDRPIQTSRAQSSPWFRRASLFAGLLIAGVGVIRVFSGFFMLPTCTSDRATDTIRQIYAGLDQPLTGLTGARLVEERETGPLCAASIATATETADITYSIYWEGWEAQVRIESVENAVLVQQPAG